MLPDKPETKKPAVMRALWVLLDVVKLAIGGTGIEFTTQHTEFNGTNFSDLLKIPLKIPTNYCFDPNKKAPEGASLLLWRLFASVILRLPRKK